ncbi:hypothetical protein IAU59_005657 [Kwoniella sp. CBS 9459]
MADENRTHKDRKAAEAKIAQLLRNVRETYDEITSGTHHDANTKTDDTAAVSSKDSQSRHLPTGDLSKRSDWVSEAFKGAPNKWSYTSGSAERTLNARFMEQNPNDKDVIAHKEQLSEAQSATATATATTATVTAGDDTVTALSHRSRAPSAAGSAKDGTEI